MKESREFETALENFILAPVYSDDIVKADEIHRAFDEKATDSNLGELHRLEYTLYHLRSRLLKAASNPKTHAEVKEVIRSFWDRVVCYEPRPVEGIDLSTFDLNLMATSQERVGEKIEDLVVGYLEQKDKRFADFWYGVASEYSWFLIPPEEIGLEVMSMRLVNKVSRMVTELSGAQVIRLLGFHQSLVEEKHKFEQLKSGRQGE